MKLAGEIAGGVALIALAIGCFIPVIFGGDIRDGGIAGRQSLIAICLVGSFNLGSFGTWLPLRRKILPRIPDGMRLNRPLMLKSIGVFLAASMMFYAGAVDRNPYLIEAFPIELAMIYISGALFLASMLPRSWSHP